MVIPPPGGGGDCESISDGDEPKNNTTPYYDREGFKSLLKEYNSWVVLSDTHESFKKAVKNIYLLLVKVYQQKGKMLLKEYMRFRGLQGKSTF